MSAPDGQLATCAASSAVVAALGSIQGLSSGLNTFGSPLTQIPECWQMEGCHTIVISPFVYSLFIIESFDAEVGIYEISPFRVFF